MSKNSIGKSQCKDQIKKQIDINTNLEILIQKNKDINYKTYKKINSYNYIIKEYDNKLKKLGNKDFEDAGLEIRSEIYKKTCENMISQYKQKIKDANENLEYHLHQLKQEIVFILNDAFIQGILAPNTIHKKDDFTIYFVPSAKLIFKQLKPVCYDKKELKLFLMECDLIDEYFVNENVDLVKITKDLEICEDGILLLKDYGLIMNGHGFKLSDPELIIKFL
jgi:hypothetical protein